MLVHYEYRNEGNSGVFLRDLWEIQILNSNGARPNVWNDGALYDFFPAMVNMSPPKGEWSVIEASVIGRKITVHHNGVLIHENQEVPARTYDKKNSEGLDNPGPFKLQGDHGRVWFTNFWVKPLD